METDIYTSKPIFIIYLQNSFSKEYLINLNKSLHTLVPFIDLHINETNKKQVKVETGKIGSPLLATNIPCQSLLKTRT